MIKDRALALPPLNLLLARALMERTRVFRLLEGYRGHEPADVDAIAAPLVRLSQLVTDIPTSRSSISIPCSPMPRRDRLDARIRVAAAAGRGAAPRDSPLSEGA